MNMEKVVLKASRRDLTGKKVGALRRQGKIPAVIYGHRIDSTPIMLNAVEVLPKLSSLTSSSTVTINLDGKEYLALVREKKRDILTKKVVHLDFQVLSRTAKMRAKVGIELTGTAPAVKDAQAIILTNLTELEVESIPENLPERFMVDLSGLAEIGDSIRVQDITPPEGVEILADPEEVIVIASAPRGEEIEAETVSEPTEPEVISGSRKAETSH
ncbi:MAG: 50S ribosomal protein L25 [Deltaproteobacteria bacterium]|nr:50S ribosomal protein L25 [Deltaproteobacteria bacterium]